MRLYDFSLFSTMTVMQLVAQGASLTEHAEAQLVLQRADLHAVS